MTHQLPPEHFQGKTVSEHLIEARKKGAFARGEMHGSELPGHLAAGAETAQEIAAALLLLATIQAPFLLLWFFALGWTLWKTGRAAIRGWAKLERLHRVIEEERWEILHHRDQEKEELQELYRAKGFEGKLLDEAISVLMADDNRLLQVMLEEELGLRLEAYEHPLKQALGALLGAGAAVALLFIGAQLWQTTGLIASAFVVAALGAGLSAHFEKRSILKATVWNLALLFLTAAILYFFAR
jgi:hypothetical protein